MNSAQIKDLLNRYHSGQCNAEEKTALERWYLHETARQQLPESDPDYDYIKKEIWQKITPKPALKINIRWVASIAAGLIVVSIVAISLYQPIKSSNTSDAAIQMAAQIYPGKPLAILTLSNGKNIQLGKQKDGLVAAESGIHIEQDHPGQLIYQAAPEARATLNSQAALNTLHIPNGGAYKLTLADGTMVWLNAASSLTYPSSFKGQKNRIVKLSGEAYFEVAKDRSALKSPFIVLSQHQEVKVLGTHFNINAYADAPAERTTLLEGAVQLTQLESRQKTLLKPGELAINAQNITILPADEAIELAWKNGRIKFKNAGLKSILDQAARWYNIEIEYPEQMPATLFTGGISRASSLATLLKLLHLSQVNFRMETGPAKKTKLIVVNP